MKNFKSQYIFNGLIFAALTLIFGIYLGNTIPWHNTFLHGFYNSIIGITFVCLFFHTLWECDARTPSEYEELSKKRFLPVRFPGKVAFLIIFVIIAHQCILGGVKMQKIYNQNVAYVAQYTQKTQQLQGLYDMTWKVTSQKWKVNDSAKSMGLEFIKAIYDSKKDAPNLGFKLLVENKLIPIEEFTGFYKDIAAFIETQRGAYYTLEVERQSIIAQQTVLLTTFPNNYYNKLLNLSQLQYKYGVLSDSTTAVFESGKENLK